MYTSTDNVSKMIKLVKGTRECIIDFRIWITFGTTGVPKIFFEI